MLKSISLILLFTVAAFAQQQSKPKNHVMRGTFKDPTGAVFTGLHLTIDGQKRIIDTTDVNGEFKIDLPVGDHVLTVVPPALYPFKAFITISENGPNPDNVDFVIDPSKVCCSFGSGRPFPKTLTFIVPAYPAAARAVKAHGEVIVALKLNPDGTVLSARALSGHPLLRELAVTAGKLSRFETVTDDAERADQEIRLSYVFMPNDEALRQGSIRYTNQYRMYVNPPLGTLDINYGRGR